MLFQLGLAAFWLLVLLVIYLLVFRQIWPLTRLSHVEPYAVLRIVGLGPLGWVAGVGLVTLVITQRALGLDLVAYSAILAVLVGLGAWELTVLRPLRRRALLRRVRDERYRVCPGCLYSLAGQDRQGRCPECGCVFDDRELRSTWEELLRS